MKQIQAFKTSDGRIFEDEKDAAKHQKNIELEDAIFKLVEQYNNNNDSSIDNYDVSRFIMENQRAICLLLDSTIIDKEALKKQIFFLIEENTYVGEGYSGVKGIEVVVEKILKLF
jgi:hypothetical protein